MGFGVWAVGFNGISESDDVFDPMVKDVGFGVHNLHDKSRDVGTCKTVKARLEHIVTLG